MVNCVSTVKTSFVLCFLLEDLMVRIGATSKVFCANRMGNAKAFALACALEAAGVAASVLWSTLPGIVASALLLGGTFVGITALGLIEARRLSHGEPRRTLAIMTASFGFGQILGPVFAGFVYDLTGSFLVPSLGAAGALLVAATLVVTLPRVTM